MFSPKRIGISSCLRKMSHFTPSVGDEMMKSKPLLCSQKRWVYRLLKSEEDIHGHRTLKAPHPVRSAKLTRVPPS